VERAKVVARAIDDLSTAERGNHLGRAMTQTLKRHVDQRVVVGLERDAQVQLQNVVERSNNQSPPPERISPRSRRPSKWPPVTGTTVRLP